MRLCQRASRAGCAGVQPALLATLRDRVHGESRRYRSGGATIGDDPAHGKLAAMGLVLTALAMASGVTDVASFVTLGNVFTSAMTGNAALLGIALSQGRTLLALHSFAALVGFTAGVLLG